jgi:hypothetical protein
MPSLYDRDQFLACLLELESALSLIAHEKCQDLQAETQTSAAIFALLRATSLFRASLSLLESGLMDACDVVRRACWEAWTLGYEFRLVGSSSHAARWHLERQKHWQADLNKINAFETSLGLTALRYGPDYGGLSEVAHPTKSAAENSFATVTALHDNPESRSNLDKVRDIIGHEDVPGVLYLLIWPISVEAPGMIRFGIRLDSMPAAESFFRRYEREDHVET